MDEAHVRAHIEFLASDALQGRGSATRDELIAATYIASQLRQYGISPAGDADANGEHGFIQQVTMSVRSFQDAPKLKLGNLELTHGKQMAVGRAGSVDFKGELQQLKLQDKAKVKAGAVVFIHLGESKDDPSVRDQIMNPLRAGAKAVLVADSAQIRIRFKAAAAELPELPASDDGLNFIILDEDATKQVEAMPDSTPAEFHGKAKGEERHTSNVIGLLPGSDTSGEAILLSAHLDHLGMDPKRSGDQIFNGADDDASGVTAVLELARVMATGKRPKRAIYFVLFGSEETGGSGARFFLDHPPLPLEKLAANLEFEMIGRPDSKVPPKNLWLTGYDRSNLGEELARHGAALVADPHPDQKFFTRSDNYALAKRGVVAHTVSSFGLHAQYHQPDDDIAHIDFAHMVFAIDSMVEPVRWLTNSDFIPQWKEGKKP